jgi:hypothetical protein
VPNNSGATAYDVTIPSNSSNFVGLDISPTINSLSMNGGTIYAAQGASPNLSVVNDATINATVYFSGAPGPPPAGPGSLSVGGNLTFGSAPAASLVNGSVTVGGNMANSQFLQLVSSSGTNVFNVAGTLRNQMGGTLVLGNERCFGFAEASCPLVLPALSLAGAPATTLGGLVNNGTMYSWAGITANTINNSGLLSFIGGGPTVHALTNSGTIYISNSESSIAPMETAGVTVGTGTPGAIHLGYNQFADGILNEVISGASTYGQIQAGPWPTPPQGALEGYGIHLDGTLDITLANGFTPTFGEKFTLITTAPGDIFGQWANVTWDSFDNGQGIFVVSYDNADGEVILQAELAPEPETFALLGLSLPPLFYYLHRRIVNAAP